LVAQTEAVIGCRLVMKFEIGCKDGADKSCMKRGVQVVEPGLGVGFLLTRSMGTQAERKGPGECNLCEN
jgi:hypothetical protein